MIRYVALIAALALAVPAYAADLSCTFTIGANTYTTNAPTTDTRALEFIDDLRNLHFPEVNDGAGGTRVMTRMEAGTEYMDRLIAGQVQFAKGLKQRRLNAEVAEADDLAGNK